jgi:adenosylcobinamide-phosphate synthase
VTYAALTAAAGAVLALALDRLLGEPARAHPLVGFGTLAQRLESMLNKPSGHHKRLAGIGAVLGLVGLPTLMLALLLSGLPRIAVVDAVILYFTFGWRSLGEHARAVQTALERDDLVAARGAVARMVSRDCDQLDATHVAGATVESVLENGNDAVFGALFWYAVAGAPGALAYRLANTLDALWGYRSDRYARFGWAAARLDDLLNLLPARLTALAYALVGNTRRALACWCTQARAWKSPNAGPVMAAGAGALGLRLGGPARYRGKVQERPPLGVGELPTAVDIGRARALIDRALALLLGAWLAAALLVA